MSPRSPPSIGATTARPSESASAVSNDSARRSARSLPDPEAIDHHLDRMLPLRVERGWLVQLVQHAVDPRPHEPLRPQALDDPRVLALALADDRGEQHEALAARARHDRIHHLGDGLRFEHPPVVRAARFARARKKQPQVVVDLGDGPDRRARGCGRSISARWRSRATAPRYAQRPASPSPRGTGVRRRKAIRRSAAAPRHRWCRTRARTCPIPRAR